MRQLRRWFILLATTAGMLAATEATAYAATLNHSEPRIGD
jgi:hypothetical protein